MITPEALEAMPPRKDDDYAMQHWNNNICCVMDTETTGLDPAYHEVIQFCCLPVDSNFVPMKGILPFYCNLKPEYPERVDPKALEINKLKLTDIMVNGLERMQAAALFEKWFEKLNIRCNKFGNPNKITALGQNLAFDIPFVKAWLGVEEYERYFHYHYRDTMIAALACNDRAAMRTEKVPFSKVSLQYMATTLGVPTDRAHDALQDCLTTAEVYRRILLRGGIF
jgi:DNA polymerase III epsilon subunit-like protein